MTVSTMIQHCYQICGNMSILCALEDEAISPDWFPYNTIIVSLPQWETEREHLRQSEVVDDWPDDTE